MVQLRIRCMDQEMLHLKIQHQEQEKILNTTILSTFIEMSWETEINKSRMMK